MPSRSRCFHRLHDLLWTLRLLHLDLWCCTKWQDKCRQFQDRSQPDSNPTLQIHTRFPLQLIGGWLRLDVAADEGRQCDWKLSNVFVWTMRIDCKMLKTNLFQLIDELSIFQLFPMNVLPLLSVWRLFGMSISKDQRQFEYFIRRDVIGLLLWARKERKSRESLKRGAQLSRLKFQNEARNLI